MYISRRSKRGLRWLKDIKFTKENILKFAIIGLIGSALLGVFLIFILFTWYGRDLPAPGKLSQISENSTVFYDRDGKVLFEMYKDKTVFLWHLMIFPAI